jgi:hypothetical protein
MSVELGMEKLLLYSVKHHRWVGWTYSPRILQWHQPRPFIAEERTPDAQRVGGWESPVSRQGSVKGKQILSEIKHRLPSH